MAPPDLSARPPAAVVGGVRRRLGRRQGLPRSSTTPVLGCSEQDVSSSMESVEAGAGATYPGKDTDNTLRKVLPDAPMDFYSPHGGATAGSYAQSKSGTSTYPIAWSPTNLPPVPNIAADTKNPADIKKKHGFFNLKLKDSKRSDGADDLVVSSPAPLNTPSKAAQFFGIHDQDSTSTIGLDRIKVHNKSSGDLGALMHHQSKEEFDESDLLVGKKARDNNTSKTRRLWDFLPSVSSPDLILEKNIAKNASSSDVGRYHHPDLPLNTVRLPSSRHNNRKMQPKILNRMSPITEATGVLRGGIHYEPDRKDAPSDAPSRRDVTLYEPRSMHQELGKQIGHSRAEWKYSANVYTPAGVPTRGPLQSMEDEFLDYSNEWFDEQRAILDEAQAKRRKMDDEVAKAKARHEEDKKWLAAQMKKNEEDLKWLAAQKQKTEDIKAAFAVELQCAGLGDYDSVAVPASDLVPTPEREHTHHHEHIHSHEHTGDHVHTCGHEHTCNAEPACNHLHTCGHVHASDHTHTHDHFDAGEDSESEDTEDLVSIRSSIDLDEEPTVHTARASPVIRVQPGMVKLVDIPARKKKKPIAAAVPEPSMQEYPESLDKGRSKLTVEHRDSENVAPTSATSSTYDAPSKSSKKEMQREESRLLVTDWIKRSGTEPLRPVSELLDADLLVDRQTPPAPVPKDGQPSPLPGMYSKHHCLTHGHIFPIEGPKHMRAKCDRCHEDVRGELWECQLAVCDWKFCGKCKKVAEKERQELASASWL